MRVAGPPSWRISEDRWPEAFDVALWFRAADRIDVASEGGVPGHQMLSRCRTRVRTRRTPPSWPRAGWPGGIRWSGCPRYHRRPTRAAGVQPARFPQPGGLACATAACHRPVAAGL